MLRLWYTATMERAGKSTAKALCRVWHHPTMNLAWDYYRSKLPLARGPYHAVILQVPGATHRLSLVFAI